MSKAKRIFEKICSIVVIGYLSYFLFFIKIEKEIISLYERLLTFFWLIVKTNSVTIILFFALFCLITVGFIDWILDDTKRKNKKMEKKEEKKEIVEAPQE